MVVQAVRARQRIPVENLNLIAFSFGVRACGFNTEILAGRF
jgi:hypothetical protein